MFAGGSSGLRPNFSFQIRTSKKAVGTAFVTFRSHCGSIRPLPTTMSVCAEMSHDTALANFQRRGFDCVCGNVRMAARSLTSVYDEHLKPSGLRSTQLAVLWAVLAVDKGTVGKIANTIAMDNSTLTRTLKLLERDKLIALCVGKDRREKQVQATSRGRKAFAAAMPLWERAQATTLGRLKGRHLREVNSLLLNLSRADRS